MKGIVRFQNPKAQFFHLNVEDELTFTPSNHGVPLEQIQEKKRLVTEMYHLNPLMDKNLLSLSGGEAQRVAMASVEMMGTKVYVLDEPSSNLDAQSIEEIKERIFDLKNQMLR